MMFYLSVLLFAATANDPNCVKGGCSGEICHHISEEPMASACLWTPAYDCYQKYGTCVTQANGECGWTESPALSDCLAGAEAEFPLNHPEGKLDE